MGFVVLSRRWVVERTFAWLVRNRRLSKDYEFLPETEEAFMYAAMIRLMLRRQADPPLFWLPPFELHTKLEYTGRTWQRIDTGLFIIL